MSGLARHAKRRDANEGSIVAALRDAGAFVWLLDTPIDLLVAFGGRWHALEVKNAQGRNRLTPEQQEMIELATGGQIPTVHVVRSPLEALEAVGAMSRSRKRQEVCGG